MKKFQFNMLAMIIMALVCVGFASCGSDDDDNGGGGLIYIAKEDQVRGDFLEDGIVLTKLTSNSLEGYWAPDKSAKIIGTKQ